MVQLMHSPQAGQGLESQLKQGKWLGAVLSLYRHAVPAVQVPCCAVLCCAVLCCAVLCCAVLAQIFDANNWLTMTAAGTDL